MSNPEGIEVGDVVKDFSGNLWEVLALHGKDACVKPADPIVFSILNLRMHKKGGE